MNEGALILFALLIGGYLLLMPLIAFIIAKGTSGQVKQLRAEIERLKLQPENQQQVESKPETPKPAAMAKVTAEENAEAIETHQPWGPRKKKADKTDPDENIAASVPPPPAKPKSPTFFDRMAANFMENWIIWLAALSLAFGGLFIVQYGLERGFLGPVARVISALGFGAALLATAEYLRRKPDMGMDGWFTVPVALAAGGIASLYAGVVSAHILYHLTSAMMGFSSMVVVSIIAVSAGLIFGPVLAVVGILGAYISPMLVTGGESAPILYLYFLAVLTTALVVERQQRWIWLSALAVGFSLFWGLVLNAELSNQTYLAFYCVAIILAVTSIPAFGIWPKWNRHNMLDETSLGALSGHYPTVLTVLTAAASTMVLGLSAGTSLILWQVSLLTFAGLTFWAIYWCQRAQNLDQLPLIFTAGLLFAATSGSPMKSYGLVENPERFFSFVGMISVTVSALFLISAFWRTPRSVRPLYWVALGAGAPVLTYFLTYAYWHRLALTSDGTWAVFALLLAAILAGSALIMLRSRIRQRRIASDLFFAGMLVATSFAAYLTIELDYLAHVAALLSLSALALVIRFKYIWTGYLIWAFVAAATSIVILDLFPVFSLKQPVLWVITVFGVVAGLLFAGYMMAKQAQLPNRVILYETATLMTLALLVCALIARVASNGRWEFEYMGLGLYATVWILSAGVQFKRMGIDDRLTKVRLYLGYGYGSLGLGTLAIAVVLSPLIRDDITGIFPVDTVMVAYVLPVLAAFALYRFDLLPSFITGKIAYGFTALMAGFIAIQEVRRFWHGSIIKLDRGTMVGELYTYTVILLTATVITVILAISRKDAGLRKIGLALAALTAAKVFLWDTAGMQGLARATVFIALGLTLAGVGWLLQVAQSSDEEDQAADESA